MPRRTSTHPLNCTPGVKRPPCVACLPLLGLTTYKSRRKFGARCAGACRCCVPHHVQQYFDHLHVHLRRNGRKRATIEDVELVYKRELLSVRGQIDLEHYEGRLKMILGIESYKTALDLLTEAAVNEGLLTHQAVQNFRDSLMSSPAEDEVSIDDVLYSLEHDGYLESQAGGYRFVSGLLEDWWRARHGQYFTPISKR